jgi:hypothetical protein
MTQRQNTTHSPRVDDQMAHEVDSLLKGRPVEAHTREDLLQEGPVGRPGFRPDGLAAPGEMTPAAVELRSTVAASLRPSAFPANRQELLELARADQAPEEVIAFLDRAPSNLRFDNVEDLWEATGRSGESRSAGDSGSLDGSGPARSGPLGGDLDGGGGAA